MQNMDTNKGKEERKLRKKEFDMQVKTVGPGINGAAMCFLIRVCGSLLVP